MVLGDLRHLSAYYQRLPSETSHPKNPKLTKAPSRFAAGEAEAAAKAAAAPPTAASGRELRKQSTKKQSLGTQKGHKHKHFIRVIPTLLGFIIKGGYLGDPYPHETKPLIPKAPRTFIVDTQALNGVPIGTLRLKYILYGHMEPYTLNPIEPL